MEHLATCQVFCPAPPVLFSLKVPSNNHEDAIFLTHFPRLNVCTYIFLCVCVCITICLPSTVSGSYEHEYLLNGRNGQCPKIYGILSLTNE